MAGLSPHVPPMTGSIVTAAIDFGTAFSGYAFAFRHEPLRIFTNAWYAGGVFSTTNKAPTTVLFDPDGNFKAFGFEAEEQYSNLVDEENSDGWYYFQNFKMELYKQENLSRETTIKDIEGKSMKAMQIFSKSIEYLKSKLIKDAGQNVSGLRDDDIAWVLSVPAIWSEPAKQFMKEAANMAGIDNCRLRLVLEPEAASLYCQANCTMRNVQAGGIVELDPFPVDYTYIVADLGGGTADIATHRVLHGGKLRELFRVTGGDLGATRINRKFVQFMEKVFGTEVMYDLKSRDRQDYLEMMTDFEAKKKMVKANSDEVMRVKFPPSLTEFIEKHHRKSPKEVVKDNSDYLVCMKGKLQLSSKVIEILFREPVDKIVQKLNDIVKNQTVPIDSLFLVGGFADSPYLQSKLTDEMKKSSPEIKIAKPAEASLHVLKGAVLTRICPATITERISPYEYGLRTSKPFNDKKHHSEEKVIRSSGIFCEVLFQKIIDKDAILQTGQKLKKRFEGPAHVENRFDGRCIELYRTSVPDTQFTTDVGCARVLKIVLKPPNDGWPKYTVFDIEFEVGETELQVLAINGSTGEMLNAKVDFLDG